MTDKSKWFVYRLEDGSAFGCFRLKPFDNPQCKSALMGLSAKKSIFKMTDFEYIKEYLTIIATHVIQDWENVSLQHKGEEEPEHETRYTPQNAYDLLANSPINIEISRWVIKKAQSIK